MNQFDRSQAPYPAHLGVHDGAANTAHAPRPATAYPTNQGPQYGSAHPSGSHPLTGSAHPVGYGQQPASAFSTGTHPLTGSTYPTNYSPPTPSAYPTAYGAAPGSTYVPQYGPAQSTGYPPHYTPAGMNGSRPPYPPAPRRRRRLPAVLAGGFLGAVVLAAVLGLQQPERYPAPAAPAAAEVPVGQPDQVGFREAGRLSALDLQPGDCYNNGELPPAPGTTTPISTVDAVPCAEPHTAQVITKISYAPTDTFTAIQGTRAAADCEKEMLEKLTDSVFTDGGYMSGTIMARDAATWDSTHAVACIVGSNGPKTGSVLK